MSVSAQQPDVSSASDPTLSAVQTPNYYQLQGHCLSITYSTTGFDGKPHFHYQDQHQTLDFEGDEIRTIDLEIGTLVTVTIRLTVDSGSTSFSVLLPNINLDRHQAYVRTEGITTVHRFSLVPMFNQGQTESYSVTGLTGTAKVVAF